MRTSIAGDFHLPYQDTEAVQKWFKHIERTNPDRVIINGDLLDGTTFSTKFKSVPGVAVTPDQEIEMAKDLLHTLRHFTDNEIVFVTGNHEFRIRQYILNLSPELKNVSPESDPDYFVRGLDELLDLERLDIQFIDVPGEYATFQDNYFENQDFLVGHFNMARTGLGATAKGLMDKYGKNVLQAHVHRMAMISLWQYDGQQIGVEGGCMCNLKNNYRRNANWQNGWVDLIDNEVELHALI